MLGRVLGFLILRRPVSSESKRGFKTRLRFVNVDVSAQPVHATLIPAKQVTSSSCVPSDAGWIGSRIGRNTWILKDDVGSTKPRPAGGFYARTPDLGRIPIMSASDALQCF